MASAMTLADFDQELVARGFDGFDVGQRQRYINWGYFAVSRYSRWYWEEVGFTFLIDSLDDYIIAPGATVKDVIAITADGPSGQRRKLEPTTRDDFLKNWLPNMSNGLTVSAGMPDKYFHWGFANPPVSALGIYLLPPPDAN